VCDARQPLGQQAAATNCGPHQQIAPAPRPVTNNCWSSNCGTRQGRRLVLWTSMVASLTLALPAAAVVVKTQLTSVRVVMARRPCCI
jgi:hypothetical protein